MREIKFRAWDIENKVMHDNAQAMVMAEKDGKPYIGFSFDTIIKDANSVVMQYTGLLDKNGVEIYEWDILHNSFIGKSRAVTFECGRFTVHKFFVTDSENNEVIGNIYENPELLDNNQ